MEKEEEEEGGGGRRVTTTTENNCVRACVGCFYVRGIISYIHMYVGGIFKDGEIRGCGCLLVADHSMPFTQYDLGNARLRNCFGGLAFRLLVVTAE